ncbi:lytic murein transglycosylase [Amycolatopsis sp. lyj-23]|uniref:lytic transglycosylase domain-containing protein n=1 Tax=Amycolatopsis sp. lyj-23 TaxID=2789283 RepID=UPI00397CDCD1
MHTIGEVRARLAAATRARDTALVATATALTTCLWTATVLVVTGQPVRSVPVAETSAAAPSGRTGPVVTVPDQPVELPVALLPLAVPPVPLAAPDPTADQALAAGLSAGGIPQVALSAYQHAAATLSGSRPSCHLDWPLIAALGRVESNHGRFGWAVLTVSGRSAPPIRGPRLDGGRFALVRDTDGGRLDGDPAFDRAVGPLQFLPQTWRAIGADGDGDGTADPDDIGDAALGAGSYLCSGGADLADPVAVRAAVYRYNHSDSYVSLVLSLAERYRTGVTVSASGGADGVTASGPGTAAVGSGAAPVPGTPALASPAPQPPARTTLPPTSAPAPTSSTVPSTSPGVPAPAPPAPATPTSSAGCVPVLGLLCL